MQSFLIFIGGISFMLLIVGIVIWFVRRISTKKSFSKRSKKVMWISLAIFFISVLFTDATPSESESAIKEESQTVVEAEETDTESETDKEAAKKIEKEKEAEVEAEKDRLAEEKLAAEKKAAAEAEAERIAAEEKVAKEKAAEEKLATEKKAAEEAEAAERLALEKKAAEEKAAAERLALEKKAAEEKAAAASAASSSENFSNCTELRKVYPSGVPEGHAAYQSKMDRDKDGYACEA